MERSFRIKFLLLFLAVAFACSSIRIFLPVAASSNLCAEKTTVSDDARHIPNAELEGFHLTGVTAGHAAVQKNIAQLQFSITYDFYKTNVSENRRIKTSSLLIRDYLFCIYPSHNFW